MDGAHAVVPSGQLPLYALTGKLRVGGANTQATKGVVVGAVLLRGVFETFYELDEVELRRHLGRYFFIDVVEVEGRATPGQAPAGETSRSTACGKLSTNGVLSSNGGASFSRIRDRRKVAAFRQR